MSPIKMPVAASGLLLLLCVVGVSCEQTVSGAPGSGAVYTRWGRTTCGHSRDELIYSGRAGGSHFQSSGGASNYLCLPRDPQWGTYSSAAQDGGEIHGVEYETTSRWNSFNPFPTNHQDEDMLCAVCHSPVMTASVMIPARKECYSSWTKAYSGYLMTQRHNQLRTEYICVDANPEASFDGTRNENGALVYTVEAKCGSLPCGPYVQNSQLTCVVCLKK